MLVNWIDDEYQSKVVTAIHEVTRKYHRHLLCLAGVALRSPAVLGAQRNFIYELVGRHQVDGLALLSGTLSNTVVPVGLAEFLGRLRPLPLCRVGVDLAGIPSVLVLDRTRSGGAAHFASDRGDSNGGEWNRRPGRADPRNGAARLAGNVEWGAVRRSTAPLPQGAFRCYHFAPLRFGGPHRLLRAAAPRC